MVYSSYVFWLYMVDPRGGGMGVATRNILSHHPLRIFENKSVIIKQNKNEMNMCVFAYWFKLYKHRFLQLIRNLSDSYHCFHDLILAGESQSTYPIENMEFLGTSWYYSFSYPPPSPQHINHKSGGKSQRSLGLFYPTMWINIFLLWHLLKLS